MKTRLLSRVTTLVALGLALGGARSEQDELSASADAGRVLDREGVAKRRAVLADRWGPVEAGAAIEIGDWLEVGSRGANALRVRLAGGTELILGPGTLVEVTSPTRVELARGEVAATVEAGESLEVGGPGEATILVRERTVLRSRKGRLERLERDPRWLVGYESNASTEAMGSLLANVDGRNVPLTIGYHKVTVDVRDQIARTVIEESFVNHTSTVLEGVFYFPLPADSSISGFGMWINGELVQGDIVEKERAREIYETILREKRDPGLLEWTGGNLFKARIYPIGAEKRIRIAYTQVLPKQGDTYAYHYALQSEMLRKTPLKRLEITVRVSSAEPLAGVSSPSHPCRIRVGEHSAEVEFTAEEFSPDRDFELRVQVEPRDERLTVIPHRRGDDGYFMLLVDAPPAPESKSPAPSSEPLELLVLADTSGSMWGAPRANQVAFIEALIGSLGDDDTFNLATCDVETRWAFDRSRPSGLEPREAALEFLERRDPLGWTDLSRAFRSAFDRASSGAQVVYVGDGVPTSGAADPVALAQEIRRGYRGQGTFHAVVPGPSSEMPVLRALAGLGGGSVRAIGGGTDPAQTAFGLLDEITAPAVKDLALDFEGLAVAAVYPETLPNLPAGGQQIVVGRFDPTGGDLSGRVVLTGRVDGEPVRFSTDVILAANDGEEEGNSFIPRLWARHHLDHLLDQGASSEVKERVIALSEDFQIVTPYSSFLVLESDEDRERFGVKKRFRMRDGEAFFTAGRASAEHELLQRQMLVAKSWRRRLREEVIRSLETMGRDLTELLRGHGSTFDGGVALGFAFESGSRLGEDFRTDDFALRADRAGLESAGEKEWSADQEGDDRFGDEAFDADELKLEEAEEEIALDGKKRMAQPAMGKSSRLDGPRDSIGELRRQLSSSGYLSAVSGTFGYGGVRSGYAGFMTDPFAAPFPGIGAPRAIAPDNQWPEEVEALASGLDRRSYLAGSERGWRFGIESSAVDRRGRAQKSFGEFLIGPDRWVKIAPHLPGYAYPVSWTVDGQRGVLTEGWRLGRQRSAVPGDDVSWAAPFPWQFGDSFRSYASYEARLVEIEGGGARIELWVASRPEQVLSLDVDVERGLVLEQAWSVDGERTRGVVHEEFVEVGGAWWPTRLRAWNQDGSPDRVTEVTVDVIELDELDRRIQSELTRRDDAILRDDAKVGLVDAKQAVEDGEAGLDARFTLLEHFASTQRWDRADPQLDAIAELVGDAPGLVPLRAIWRQQSRRNEELRVELQKAAQRLADSPRDGEYTLAIELIQYTQGLNQGSEVLAVLDALRPVFGRQAGILDAELPWYQRRLQALANMNRPRELLLAYRDAADRWPFQLSIQTNFASQLAQSGEVDAAIARLETVESEYGPWQPNERAQIRGAIANILWQGYRLEQLVETFEAWERQAIEVSNSNLVSQYLSALIFLDREREAWSQIDEWLDLAARDERSNTEQARLNASIQHALGQGYQLYRQRYEDDRAARLAEIARVLAARDDDTYLAGTIVQHWRFRNTDDGRALLNELFSEVERSVETVSASRLQAWIGWLRNAAFEPAEGQPEEGETVWIAIFERTLERWRGAEDPAEREPLAQIVRTYGSPELRVRLFRQVLAEADGEEERIGAAAQLYQGLRALTWSEAVERELAGLLPVMARAGDSDPLREDLVSANIDQRILAVYDLVNWIVRARTEAIVTALPEFESMTRRTLAKERSKARRTAREGAAALMLELQRSLEPDPLREFCEVERTFLEVTIRTDLAGAWARSLELLVSAVDSFAAAKEPDEVPARDRILAARCIATCSLLLLFADESELDARKAELFSQLERLVEEGVEFPNGSTSTRDVLIALDLGDELEEALAVWFDGGQEFARIRFGREFAFVLAERGRLERATEVLEEIGRIDELAASDLRMLAGWYTALDRQGASLEAKIRSYDVMGADRLANELYSVAQTYQRQGDDVPPEMDPEIPLRLVVLMRKAPRPHYHFWILQSLYEATKDYRLLECLPEAVIGHSAQGIYPFLSQVGGFAGSIDEEATVDRVRTQLAERRETAETDADRRALWLLEFKVVHQAARQSQGTERHAERALHALESSFQGEWQDGEIGLMAEFLAGQGRLEPDALALEQKRQLRALAQLAQDPDERFSVIGHLASTLWSYSERDEAVRVLEAALGERRAAAGGVLPVHAHQGLSTLSSWWSAMKSFRRAEGMWLAELDAGHAPPQQLWMRERLFELYRDTVLVGGGLSLGEGDELYAAVVDAMESDLAIRANERHARNVVNVLCDLWRRAHRDLKRSEPGPDATDFAFTKLPRVLGLYQYRDGQQMVAAVADCLREVVGDRDSVEFLVTRAENEPSWLRMQNQDFWPQHANRLGYAVHGARSLEGSLERRVLAVILAELKEDLRSRESRNRTLYDNRYGHFWSKMRAEYLAATFEFAEERRESPHAIAYTAEYLFRGLSAFDEAIDILFDAHRRGILHLEGRDQLATYLQERSRFAESIALVQGLIEDRPAEARYRVMMMLAYFETDDLPARDRALAQAEAWLRENDEWNEGVIATLGEGCLRTELYRDCVRLLDDAIALRVRSAANRGVGDGVLCTYYRNQSGAYAGLGETSKAVDAAAGAIVSWGRSIHQRQQELEVLISVLDQAEDLNAYVAELDAEVAASGLENPIVRKAIGQVYLRRKDHERAVAQLTAALGSQPNDLETSQLLLNAYDGMQRPDLAAEALLDRARAAGHELTLYEDLGARLLALEQAERAERSFTTLVELSPHESEGHQALAELRERQGRYDEAADHWRHVSRIRAKEPTGYLGLARALIRLKRIDEARDVLDHLRTTSWPTRFGDVRSSADSMLKEIVSAR